MVNSKRKGKVGELEVARILREMGFGNVRRGQQYSGLGADDLVGLPGLHLEVKRRGIATVHGWMAQAVSDAKGRPPLVLHRGDRQEWLVTLRLDELIKVSKAIAELSDES